jgi:predicted negative regulator of RcsB-dependent stress response
MATTHRRLSRKELRQPDEFVSLLDRIGNYTAANLARVIIGAVVAIGIITIAFSWRFYARYQHRIAAEEFYQAITALDHRDFKGAKQGFSTLETERRGGELGRLARLYVGSTYLAEKEPAKARDALETYLKVRDQPTFRQLALMQLGVIYEDSGQFQKACDTYSEAVSLEGPEKARAAIGAARMQARLGDKRGAVGAYQRFLKENPFAPERPEVMEGLAQLGVAPEASAGQVESHAAARLRGVASPPPNSRSR